MEQTTPDDEVHKRAITFIERKWGSLRDLPANLVPVVWVTVFRSQETALIVERSGGSNALVKSTLLDHGKLSLEFNEAIRRIQFLEKIIPVIRSSSSADRLADSQLVVDVLKWGIADAGDMSLLRRTLLRQFAKVDSMYGLSFPTEIVG